MAESGGEALSHVDRAPPMCTTTCGSERIASHSWTTVLTGGALHQYVFRSWPRELR